MRRMSVSANVQHNRTDLCVAPCDNSLNPGRGREQVNSSRLSDRSLTTTWRVYSAVNDRPVMAPKELSINES